MTLYLLFFQAIFMLPNIAPSEESMGSLHAELQVLEQVVYSHKHNVLIINLGGGDTPEFVSRNCFTCPACGT
jgi:hypothetical protein